MTLRKTPPPGTRLAWFATLVALADGLTRVGFVNWFAQTVATKLEGVFPQAAVAMLLVINFFGHYLFASVTAHVTAMIPVLLAVASTVPGIHMHTLALGSVPSTRDHGHYRPRTQVVRARFITVAVICRPPTTGGWAQFSA